MRLLAYVASLVLLGTLIFFAVILTGKAFGSDYIHMSFCLGMAAMLFFLAFHVYVNLTEPAREKFLQTFRGDS